MEFVDVLESQDLNSVHAKSLAPEFAKATSKKKLEILSYGLAGQ